MWRRLVSWLVAAIALFLFVGFITPALEPCPIETAHGPVTVPSRLLRHSIEQIGVALGSVAVGGAILLAVNWRSVARWRKGNAPRNPRRRRLLWDGMAVAHVITWTTLAVVLLRVWMRTGVPVVPLGRMGFWLSATFGVYFGVTLPLVFAWVLSIQRHKAMAEWAKWVCGVCTALVPLVGLVYHIRVFRDPEKPQEDSGANPQLRAEAPQGEGRVRSV